MRYDAETEALICAAGKFARRMGHSYVGSAHLLLAMVQNRGFAGGILRGYGMNMTLTEDMTVVLYGKGTPELPLPQGLTAELQGILRGAAKEAQLHGSREIGAKHMLLSLVRREGTAAGELLTCNGIDPGELFTVAVEQSAWEGTVVDRPRKGARNTKLLEQFGEDLVMKASTMEPVVSREREIDMVIGILCRKNKNNPALVGEPGVGKTAIAEGLAQRMAVGNVPPQLKEKRQSRKVLPSGWLREMYRPS